MVEDGTGRLVGILTNRDVRFAIDPRQPVRELMTRICRTSRWSPCATASSGKRPSALLHKYRIEKLLVVDEDYRCVGLITVKDIEKAERFPNAVQGRARPPARRRGDRRRRARAASARRLLLEAEVDVIVVDTAHGHSDGVLERSRGIKRRRNSAQVIAGNIATAEGARALDRRRRRRGEGRHRPGLDLHHAGGRRCRRAAVHRDRGAWPRCAERRACR